MELRIRDLALIQDELDRRIFELHQTTREKTRDDRILALLVEVGELANETRCFKYWSLKAPSSDDIVFEEFSDVLHFVLSLGLDLGYAGDRIDFEVSEERLNTLFHHMYQAIYEFSRSNTVEDYEKLLNVMCILAYKLGMSPEAMREMYLLKNKKNHQRQDNSY